MRYVLRANVLLLVLLLLCAACGRLQAARPVDDPNYAISLAVEPQPVMVGPARLAVSVADRQGKPAAVSHLRVEGDMTHAGMAPVIVESQGDPAGRTQVAFTWTMAGDWVVDVSVTLGDGRTVGKQFAVRVGQ